jgi:hypothetical protein
MNRLLCPNFFCSVKRQTLVRSAVREWSSALKPQWHRALDSSPNAYEVCVVRLDASVVIAAQCAVSGPSGLSPKRSAGAPFIVTTFALRDRRANLRGDFARNRVKRFEFPE